jgi:hypothetical protein
MIWTILGTVGIVLATIAWLILREALGTSTGVLGWLFARGIWQLAGAMENKGLNDPVYKKNLQRLIERNRQFEEARNEPHS